MKSSTCTCTERKNATKLRRYDRSDFASGSGQVYSRDSIVTRDAMVAFAKCDLPLKEKRSELRLHVNR